MTDTATLEARLNQLTPEQRARLLQTYRAAKEKEPELRRLDARRFRLSDAQKRLWLTETVEGPDYKYNMVSAYELTGRLDTAALEASFASIIDRHPVLKSRFVESGAEVFQEPVDGFEFRIACQDLTACPEAEREALLQNLIMDEARWRFRLTEGPLFRVTIYRLGPERHIMQMNVHHAIFDGWSKTILLRELAQCYEAAVTGVPAQLPEPELRFGDFAEYQRAQSARMRDQLEYWKTCLAGSPPLLELPTDHKRPALAGSHGEAVPIRLDAELTSRLRLLGQRHGATLYMTMLAGFVALLHRWSGQPDVSVGAPVDNRADLRLKQTIGYFLNTVVVRARIGASDTFTDLLRNVRDGALGALRNQDVPFDQVIEALNPPRSQSFSPLFQVMFVFQHESAGPVQLHGLESRKLDVGTATSKYDLYCTLLEDKDGLVGWLQFRTDLFERPTAESMVTAYRSILEAVTANHDAPILSLPLLPAATAREVARAGAGSPAVPPGLGFIERFRSQVAAAPDQLCLKDDRSALSRAQVDLRARSIAAALRAWGIVPGQVVGLRSERHADAVCAILAIVMAGGIVMPLDVSWPDARRDAILAQVPDCPILTDGDADAEAGIFNIAALAAAGSEAAEAFSPHLAKPDEPLYLLFTSGSTGRPKGVTGTHGGLMNRLDWQLETFPLRAGDVMAQRTPLGFIDSYIELFLSLPHGMPLVVIPSAVVKDPFALVDCLSENGVTHLVTVPSLLRVVLDNYPELHRYCPSLRIAVSSGEAVAPDLAAKFREALPDGILLNAYGSTEVSDVIYHAFTPGAPCDPSPLGRPLHGCEAAIIDEAGNILPFGVSGRLAVTGPATPDRYLGEEPFSNPRFLRRPTADGIVATWFDTGDLGRLTRDGMFEYLGRRDHLLKVRGFRVEAGEIESALCRLHWVVECAVVRVADGERLEQLVAYVVASSEASDPDPAALRTHLRGLLPDYMVPSRFAIVDELPKTYNGKIDRRQLEARGLPEIPAEQIVAPRTETEQRVAGIWQDVLKLDRVSVTAHFLDLGGYSLLAMRIAAAISEEMGVGIRVDDILSLPTVAELARRIDALREIAAVSTSVHEDQTSCVLEI